MTIRIDTQIYTLSPIGTSPHRGEAALTKRRLKLKITQQFDASVLSVG